MRIDIHIHYHPDEETAERLCRTEDKLDEVLERIIEMAIDTKAALDAVRQLTTDSASQRELLKQIKAGLDKALSDLAAALAANDPAAAAQAQQDLAEIANLANTEDAAVKDAIAANTPPATA